MAPTTLTPGTHLGPYEIVALLGVGGMGEVYRATDTNLKRQVAIKVLPTAVAGDADRLARFRREAEVLAALNHPNVAHIHGLEKAGGTIALVMELVEGPTLADRIVQGAIPLAEALPIAKQIAEALEAAHEQGIIHRDLKPANIKVRDDGTVKVLDFGLAKAFDPAASSLPNATMSPTLSMQATQAGIILGTAAYMSPEQARGKAVDKRADVWAFGCVLFEMLTGTRAFAGEDITDTLAAVVRAEPDWSLVPRAISPTLLVFLRRSLQKDPKQRVGDIRDVRLALEGAFETPAVSTDTTAPAPVAPRRVAPVAIAVLAALVATLAMWVATRPTPARPPQPVHFAILPPAAQPLAIQGADRDIAISPDGTHIVYRAGASQTRAQLMVRALNELEARPLTGTENARTPFISPDGHWVGFFADSGELRKVSMTGGPTISLCRTSGGARGASWGPDDTIVFATADPTTGLLSVAGGGGEPKVITKPDTAKGEQDHLFPSVLPDGRAVLFTIGGGQPDNAQVAVLDLTTGQRKTLIRGGSQAEYVDTSTGSGQAGFLIYAASGSLRAVRFDLARLQVLSDPVPAVDQVMTMADGAGEFSLSRQGALVLVPGTLGAQIITPRSLAWVTRQGREEPIKAPPRTYATARLSPDGSRVALGISDQANDIWILDLARQTLERLTKDPGLDMSPVWTPDGRSIIWTATATNSLQNVYRQAADGTGAPERLTTSPNGQFPTSISGDGLRLVLWEGGASPVNDDILTLSLERSSNAPPHPEPLVHTTAKELNAEISPDGHWIAYESDESGPYEVYVRPFPKADEGRTLISTAGGTRAAWARNNRELFYIDAGGFLTAVPVQTAGSIFKAGNPTRLLSTKYFAGASSRGLALRGYDVSADAQRFLMIKDSASSEQPSNATPASMVVVLNWLEELKQRVPVK